MTQLKAGDRVDCRINFATIVSPYKEYDEVRTFEIVAVDAHGYYLYVPHYVILKDSIVADKSRCRHLGIDKKFLDEHIVYINTSCVARVVYILEGMSCACCQDFYPMAEANQPNGTLLCFSCRQNPWR